MFVRNLMIAATFASVAVSGFAKESQPGAAKPAAAPAECVAHKDAASCGKDKACKWTVDAKAPTKGSCAKADAKAK